MEGVVNYSGYICSRPIRRGAFVDFVMAVNTAGGYSYFPCSAANTRFDFGDYITVSGVVVKEKNFDELLVLKFK